MYIIEIGWKTLLNIINIYGKRVGSKRPEILLINMLTILAQICSN